MTCHFCSRQTSGQSDALKRHRAATDKCSGVIVSTSDYKFHSQADSLRDFLQNINILFVADQ